MEPVHHLAQAIAFRARFHDGIGQGIFDPGELQGGGNDFEVGQVGVANHLTGPHRRKAFFLQDVGTQ